MTTMHLRPRANMRLSALGLVLSLGLILGASSLKRAGAAEELPVEEHACVHPEAGHSTGSPPREADPLERRAERETAPAAVPSGGHPEGEVNL